MSEREAGRGGEPKLEVVFVEERAVAGSVGNLFITMTRGHQDQACLRRLYDALVVHYRRWPGGAGALAVIEAGAYGGMVSAEERHEITRMARDFHPLGAALVIEGSGFRPAAMRSLVAGVYLVTRSPYPRKIFDDVGDAASWITETAGAGRPGAVTAGLLVESVEKLRQNGRPAASP